ncbi:SCO family protein [Pollutimonas bauzanensis]|uniref:Protein SCO1/2 n=1 Tax=Pollutimonas bauzanensis TaxID=658167 RepID=A0A1M5PUS8_9BURK|nr:SCO family protein [Pollutimonas bauzanensis]SHH05356.1 protein SCO1/2 [Pollutimonas bauzanensis]
MRLLAAILLVCGLGLGAICLQTDGFTVLTTEAARRADVLRHPRAVPDSPLRGGSGASTTLLRNLRSDGRVAIVNFMYTRCFSICLAMGAQFQQLQAQIQGRGLAGKVRLLSISFDQADTPELLSRYERRMAADPVIWQSMAIAGAGPRLALLDAFGIVVVPAAWGQYEHNAAYHIVTPGGRLVRIVDMDDTQSLLDYAAAQAGKEGRS